MSLKLELDQIEDFFAPGQNLATSFAKYEYRPQQQRMATKITDVFKEKKHLLIEAGTGTGKSLAYLVPSIFSSLVEEEKVVISTNTINLQEQLINKDIPLLQEVFELDFKAVLVKGRRNYVCLRRLIQYEKNAQLTADKYDKLSKINQWVLKTETGCRSDLKFKVEFELWDQIAAKSELCLRANCPYYEQCHFIFARREVEEADLLIVNHHLLFADLALRKEEDLEEQTAVLPAYKKIVFDEAHNIEEVATNYLGLKLNKEGIVKFLQSLHHSEEGIGVLLQLRLASSKLKDKLKQSFQKRIDNDLVPLVRRLTEKVHSLFNQLIKFLDSNFKEYKVRLTEEVREKELWQQVIKVEFENFLLDLSSLRHGLEGLFEELALTEDELENFDALAVELAAKIDFCNKVKQTIEEVIETPQQDYVYWLEHRSDNCSLCSAPLDISQELQVNLLEKMDSVIFTSATLTVDNSFDFISKNLGLQEFTVDNLEVGSPFDYRNQLRIGVIKDLSNPNQKSFVQEVVRAVKNIVQIREGNSLVLFTSYWMLNQVYQELLEELDQLKINNLYCQGMKSRHQLIEEFKANQKSLLLGTASFWEGVDIPGEQLSCVVIVKLPFLVPTDPVIAAKIEDLEANGENSFFNYMLPKAVIKFRQGIGRLIRSKEDQGWVIILDNRVVSKSYGNIFLKSFPSESQIVIDKLNKLTDKLID
ncbi:DEAD/DEAH box helicase family protein [Natroniella sulfidigena]|uniref:ATP-dependent DNA helicase n=1 Tax=Natroniella sulfidigena TaxID=723921 RepID=UPI00200B59B2|nr:helicase C-terminal domain-containing protein [Natroniella sulfidigena]MCK8816475.1 DEAD/DEAH box helicase family protein [Natroniella sulfidigena]